MCRKRVGDEHLRLGETQQAYCHPGSHCLWAPSEQWVYLVCVVYCLVWRGRPGSWGVEVSWGRCIVALVMCSAARLVPGQKEMGVQWRHPRFHTVCSGGDIPQCHLHTAWSQTGSAGLKAVQGAPVSGWAGFLLQEPHPRGEMGGGIGGRNHLSRQPSLRLEQSFTARL